MSAEKGVDGLEAAVARGGAVGGDGAGAAGQQHAGVGAVGAGRDHTLGDGGLGDYPPPPPIRVFCPSPSLGHPQGGGANFGQKCFLMHFLATY